MPTRGTWIADLVIDAAEAVTGSVSIEAADGLTLNGTVLADRTGVHLDSCYLRIVGGAGGLGKNVSGSYQRAQLRDPLGAVLRAAGETQASNISVSILTAPLTRWTLGPCRAARALDDLARAAGSDITWRVLEDGSVWMGAETWPELLLGDGDVISDAVPSARHYELAVDTLRLKPGVTIDGVGKVAAVEHFISPDRIRSTAWAE
jgi:hypothetical protein